MGNPLHDRRTISEWASAGQVIEIAEKIDSFSGLADVVAADLSALEPGQVPSGWRNSVVSGELRFGFADVNSRVPTVSGSASARVDAVCQRCLEPFQLRLDVEPRLLLLGSDQAVSGYDDFEVWELDEPTLRPLDIVEELLIMAVPFVATHDTAAECKVLSSDTVSAGSDAEKRVRPFAALREQMTRELEDSDD